MLVDEAGMPLQFANRYAYSMIEKPGRSLHSVKQALYVISRLYLWAEIQGVDLKQILFYGELLDEDQISDVVDFIQFTSITQNKIKAEPLPRIEVMLSALETRRKSFTLERIAKL